jgi:signal transduction histidine kinase
VTPDRLAPEPPGSRARATAGVRGRWRSQPVLVRDLVGALVVLVAFAALHALSSDRSAPSVASTVALVVACVALVWRRTRPTTVVVVIVAAMVLTAAVDGESSLAFGPGLVAIYTVATCRGRLEAAVVTAASAFAYTGTLVVAGGLEPWGAEMVLVVVLFVVSATLGMAVGAQRAVVAAARERAARAEESREVEAVRRVTQERLRIARELHDVVAHHVAVISVQAGAAEALFDKRPVAAREAIGHVRDAGERVLVEMSSLLHLLREPDDGGGAAPAPGIAGLPALLDEARATGLEIVERTSGTPGVLPAVVDLTAYRVVQEALTNAHRHGTGSAEVSLAHSAEGVVVEVVNPLPAGPSASAQPSPPASAQTSARTSAQPWPHGSGLGLVGVRERVAAVGGTVRIGPRDGAWAVRAELPAGAPSSSGTDLPRAGEVDAPPPDPTPQEAP